MRRLRERTIVWMILAAAAGMLIMLASGCAGSPTRSAGSVSLREVHNSIVIIGVQEAATEADKAVAVPVDAALSGLPGGQ